MRNGNECWHREAFGAYKGECVLAIWADFRIEGA